MPTKYRLIDRLAGIEITTNSENVIEKLLTTKFTRVKKNMFILKKSKKKKRRKKYRKKKARRKKK